MTSRLLNDRTAIWMYVLFPQWRALVGKKYERKVVRGRYWFYWVEVRMTVNTLTFLYSVSYKPRIFTRTEEKIPTDLADVLMTRSRGRQRVSVSPGNNPVGHYRRSGVPCDETYFSSSILSWTRHMWQLYLPTTTTSTSTVTIYIVVWVIGNIVIHVAFPVLYPPVYPKSYKPN